MKRLIICADGTWNEAEANDPETQRPLPTNVLKVARAILPRDEHGLEQVVYYHEGVGTFGSWDKFTGGAFGRGMERNVRALYRFIVNNFVDGDEIYLFGFSRGAFTARTLVGFMNKVGLLQKDDEYYTKVLYDLYESSAGQNSEAWSQAFRNIKDHRPCPSIKFVGVWDTVGALGAPGMLGKFTGNKYKYHDVDLNSNVKNAHHALAIDERRSPFKPSLFTKPTGWEGTLSQVWFPGVHSNVGGSYKPDGLANEALHWIIEKSQSCGLCFDEAYLSHYLACFNSTLNDSM
jgi:uncharacterized protein (DUF2235 family)